jgi:hypothetical protein
MKALKAWLLLLFFNPALSQVPYKLLTAAQMQGDLEILRSAWTTLHPGLYRYNSPRQIEGYFSNLKSRFSKPADERTFYLSLSQLAEKIKCGHTYLNPLNLGKSTRERILPARVIPLFFEIVSGNKIILTHDLSGNEGVEKGDEIVSINHIASKRIIDSLLTVSRSDGNNATGKKLNNINETTDEAKNHSLFDIYFPLFFPTATETFIITTKKFNKHARKEIKVKGLTLPERVKAYEKLFGAIPVAEKTWDYKMLNTQTAYMKFGTFAFWNSNFNPRRFVDSIFLDLSGKKEIKNLIIDIRNNEGGDNTSDHILSYITAKKTGCEDPDRRCYRYLAVPDSLLVFLDTWDNSFKKSKDPNKFLENELGLYEEKRAGEPCDHIEPRSNGFRGKVFLLINAKNSSAGYEMARSFKTAELGLIVGETTGGSQQGINGGEFFFLTLPSSTFEIDLPLIYNYHPNKPDQGINPDYEIKTTQRDIYDNKDAQLEFVLSFISK